MPYDNDSPTKTNFALFPNKYAKTDRHPQLVGNVEFNRNLLKTMVAKMKEGEDPVILRMACWPERMASSGSTMFRSCVLEVQEKREEPAKDDFDVGDGDDGDDEGDATETKNSDLFGDDEDDDLPF